jgi:mRNA interferase YafQ
MRTIDFSAQFRRDFKREVRGNNATLLAELLPVLVALVSDQPLAPKYKDHPLTSPKGVRDCHVRPDLVLLYEKPSHDTLLLIRLGSHSELGL